MSQNRHWPLHTTTGPLRHPPTAAQRSGLRGAAPPGNVSPGAGGTRQSQRHKPGTALLGLWQPPPRGAGQLRARAAPPRHQQPRLVGQEPRTVLVDVLTHTRPPQRPEWGR